MANQHYGSFDRIVQDKLNMDAKTFLEKCSRDGLSYFDAHKRVGVNALTIKKIF